MRRICAWLLCCVCASSVSGQTIPELFRKADRQDMERWVDSVYNRLSDDERIGQLFMVVADPAADAPNMRRLMRYVNEVKIGGILFHRGNPVTQAEVTNRLQQASRIPMLVALDGEWGLSMRLSGTTRFPKNMMLGAIEDTKLIEAYGQEVARQCREMGIHINFAPDLDVNTRAGNPVIGLRSFGENPDAVSEKGVAYARGLESEGILSVAKHFPGHGDSADDSHYTLPAIRHDRQRLDSVELLPFKRYIHEGFSGMMTGHLYVPALDKTPGKAASFSRPIVTDLLRKEFGFTGLCFTDALAMKGASPESADNPCVKALLAGNDVLLASASPVSDFAMVKNAVGTGVLDRKEIEAKCRKILQYKFIAGLNSYKPVDTEELSERLNTPHAAWLAARLNADAVTLLKNENDILPLKRLDQKRIAALSIGEAEGNEFQTFLNRYDTVRCFSLPHTATAAQIQKVYSRLEEDYDVIICGVHTVRIPESQQLRRLAARKELVYVFFTLPYFCRDYSKSIEQAGAVVMAYETTPLAQRFAAQAVFGGIAAKGKLPVTIPDLYFAGTGIFTEKTRLGYHEPEEAGLNPVRLAVIDGIVQEGLDEQAFPGCQVLVAKDGMVVYRKSFGYYDYSRRQTVTDTSVYDLASVSKVTGTLPAVMLAYDERKFTLNSKIGEYVPGLKGSDKQDFTIRELLYHQSGLIPTIRFYEKAIDEDSYTGDLYSRSRKATHPLHFDVSSWVQTDFTYLPSLVSDTQKPGFTTQAAHRFYVHDSFRDTIMKEIRDSKLSRRGRYVYSCINFILLKMMVENQSDVPMDQLLRTKFYDRLGARSLTYNPLRRMDSLRIVPTEQDDFVRRQLLRGYVHDEAAAFQGGVSGNAGLFSDANDLAKLLQLYLNLGMYGGERYLSEETTRLFTQNKSPNSRRGLGFDKPHVGNPDASPCGMLAPASVYGHTGYTGTCFWIDPDSRLVYIFLSNRVNPTRANNKLSSLDIRTRIQDAIYKAISDK